MKTTHVAAAAVAVAVTTAGCGVSIAGTGTEQPTISTSVWINHDAYSWRQMPLDPGGAAPRYGESALRPGSTITQRLADGGAATCTAGAAFVGAEGQYAAASGHCDEGNGAAVYLGGPDATTVTRLGRYVDTVGGEIPGYGADSTLLQLAPGQRLAPDAGMIDGRWPVIGVMPAAEVGKLVSRTSVCVMVPSGPRCGSLGEVSRETFDIEFDGAPITEGDSGAAAFVVTDSADAVLLGGISARTDTASRVSYVTVSYYEPMVRAQSLRPVNGK